MATRSEIERVLREVSAPQHGCVTRSQLLAAGLGASTVDRLIRAGRLSATRRGVYRVGPLGAPLAEEASAVLRCGIDCTISHVTAAVLHGLVAAAPAGRPVDVTMPRRRLRRIAGIRIHRVRDPRPDEVTTVRGLPVTTPARTLLDVAETASPRDVEQALAAAVRHKLLTLEELRRVVERHPRHRGAPVIRQLLDLEAAPAFTRSQAEERLLSLLRRARLPRAELNVTVLGFEVDFLWAQAGLIVEVDGYAFHGSARSFAADRRRDAELTAAGYRVLRFTWTDLTEDSHATVARLAQALR